MLDQFELASASVIGKEHRRVGRNNQDAHYITQTDDYLIALVADGCGSSPHSEIGAQLGVRFAARIIADELAKHGQGAYIWINRALVGELNLIKRWLGADPAEAVRDYLLFTLVGAVITPEAADFFSFGDGVIAVNGEIIPIDCVENAPPYPAYQLFEPGALQVPAGDLQFQLHRRLPTAELDSFLIGSDGASDLRAATGRTLPGRDERVEPFERLWEADGFFENPDALRRYLAQVNRESVKLDREQVALKKELGHLSDDTTLIVGRRKEAETCPKPTLTEEPSGLIRPSFFSRVAKRMSISTEAKP